MIFHLTCECVVIPMIDRDNTLRYCDIMSNDIHIGTLRYGPSLGKWALSLSSRNVGVTADFHNKIYFCLGEILKIKLAEGIQLQHA